MGEMYAPSWIVDGFHFSGMAPYHRNLGQEYDENGWAHIVEKESGFITGAKPRTNRVPRAGTAPGSYRGPSSREERIITLEGRTWTRTRQDRERAELALAGLCANPDELYEFRRATDVMDQTILVELDDAPMVEMINSHTLKWSFQFAAPDPRKLDTTWQQPVTGLPTAGSGGLDFSGGGLDIDPLYLDFGEPSQDGSVMVGNEGTTDSWPLFAVAGPVINPVIFEPATGSTLRYTGTIPRGQVLWINCAIETQRGVPGHGVFLDQSNRRGSLAVLGEWPRVGAMRTGYYQFFAADYNGDALMTCWFRSAWL